MSIPIKPRIITLCSDFGVDDFRSAALKARILNLSPDIHLVDVTHQIRPFDLVEAAFMTSNSYLYFPQQTIHVIWVFSLGADNGILLAEYRDHYFILPDNGILSLLVDQLSECRVFRISDDSFEFRDRISSAVRNLIVEENPLELYDECQHFERKINVSPVYHRDRIQARIYSIDRYGNLILNIRKDPFIEISDQRKFSFITAAQVEISNFQIGESLVENGSFFMYFNQAGFMTLGLCNGNAARTLDLVKEDIIQIIFK